jgi:hypothetical protein
MYASKKGFFFRKIFQENRFSGVKLSKTGTYATVRRGARSAS